VHKRHRGVTSGKREKKGRKPGFKKRQNDTIETEVNPERGGLWRVKKAMKLVSKLRGWKGGEWRKT